MKTTNIFAVFLDILFPPSPEQRSVREFSVEEIRGIRAPERTSEDFIEPLFTWRHPYIRTLISELKYRRNRRALRIAGTLLSENILLFLSEKQQFGTYENPILVPIPMHSAKKRSRGWNQVELLAKEITRQIPGIGYAPAVMKIKNTPRQTEVGRRKERLSNIEGSFAVRDVRDIRKKDVILIDDVTTTGATLKEVRSVLLTAGARDVHAFTLAH